MYAKQAYDREVRDIVLRNYVADCVGAMANARSRYYDLVNGAYSRESGDYDAEEIVNRVIERAGLEVRQHEPSGSSGEDIGR